MAEIPRKALDALTREVNGIGEDAQARVLKVLEAVEWAPGNIAECRAAVVDALLSVMPSYTDAAAQAGADFYDAVRETVVGSPLGAEAFSGFDPDALDGAVRAFVQDIVADGAVEQFNRNVLKRVARDVRRSPNMAMARNAARDPLKPRYARIPSGSDTCGFCLMLASRGFDYTTPEAAGHAHDDCDCRVMQGYDGMTVEGYDPDALYSDYLDGAFGTFKSKKRANGARRPKALKDDPSGKRFGSIGEMCAYLSESASLEELQSRSDEVSGVLDGFFSNKKHRDNYLADLRRAASRRHGELSKGGKPGIVTYTKPRSELEPHEAAGIDWLAARGYDIETIPEIGSAPANLDIIMGGEEWEMKNVTNARGSVSNQLKRIREKWRKLMMDGSPRGVITCEGCASTLDDVCDGIALRIKDGERYLVVYWDGMTREVSK